MISPDRSCELLRSYAATSCERSFRELAAGWSGMVYATALRVAHGEKAMAEDVTQAVFSRLAAAPEKVKDPRALGAWLHAAATGLARDALRREARRRRREKLSHDVMLPPPDGLTAGDDGAISSELDGALSQLPPQDSRLLVMRFWHDLDWRSIGQSFGVSDDTAQKRMHRALERLRRILARRGITSPVSTISASLAATAPRDLTAATTVRILASVFQSTPATTVPATLAMTTKAKCVIAAAAILAAAAIPLALRQLPQTNTPGTENGPLQPAFESAPARMKRIDPVVPSAGSAVASNAAESTELPEEERSDDLTPAVDVEALNRARITEKVAVLRTELGLTTEQEDVIAQALELGQIQYRISPPNVIPVKPTEDDLKRMEETILGALTPDQQAAYKAFRAEETANALEAAANRDLSRLQSLLTLSPEQKDQAFAVFSDIASREVNLPVLDPEREAEAIREAERTRWNERQEALSSFLTPEQMALLNQAGNPFHPGSGG